MASEPSIAAPLWPAMTPPQVEALLTAPGAKFEMETIPIRGIRTRTWKNAPPQMRALVSLSRSTATGWRRSTRTKG